MEERAMTWFEALVRARGLDGLRRIAHRRDRAEGIAAQAVIIGVTAARNGYDPGSSERHHKQLEGGELGPD